MHSTRLTGRVYFFVKCAASGYFRLFDVSPVFDGFLLFLARLCVLEVDNLERCLCKGIDGQLSVDLLRHGNRLVTQKILCNIKRDTGGLQVGRISVSQAVWREIISHNDVSGSIAPPAICAPISRSSACLNERHICFMDVSVCGLPVVGCVKRQPLLFSSTLCQRSRGLYPDGVPLAIIAKRFAETSV